MTVAYDLARLVIQCVGALKSGDPDWQRKKLQELSALKQLGKTLELRAEHELNLLRLDLEGELERARETQKRVSRDYKEFLDSIDEMKTKILQTFPDMPRPMAFVIHHHARELIDDMWQRSGERARELSKAQIMEFLTVVYDDTTQVMIGEVTKKIPYRTIQLVKGSQKAS